MSFARVRPAPGKSRPRANPVWGTGRGGHETNGDARDHGRGRADEAALRTAGDTGSPRVTSAFKFAHFTPGSASRCCCTWIVIPNFLMASVIALGSTRARGALVKRVVFSALTDAIAQLQHLLPGQNELRERLLEPPARPYFSKEQWCRL